ncbi:MAG: GIY-YIG nuclease family protein [Candidatus Zixiibacteriota bacterium]
MKSAFVYMMASGRNGTLYVGVTTNLIQRITAHRPGLVPGFTAKYQVKLLVYWEEHASVVEAIAAEKRWKNRRRAAKIAMIERINPEWRDLYKDLAH